jgi:hypothetical protein
MDTPLTLTIPTDEKLQEALQERAALQGKTVPDLAREILSEALEERTLGERVGHLRGQLRFQETGAGWPPGFFEQLRAVDSETVAAVDELLASVRQARTSKPPRSL